MILKDKIAVITGGSRGIGKAVAFAFAREGARLFLVARSEEELKKTRDELVARGASVDILAGDVSDEKTIEAVRARLGSALDILVNAAGIYGPIGRIEDVSLADWQKTLAVNLTGTFLFTKMAIVLMRARGGGKIINFAGGGEGARPRFVPYVSSKGAIIRFTESVAADLAPDNIDVNAIAPGAVNTTFLDELVSAGPERAGKDMYEKALRQKREGGVPPEVAAKLCVFLASQKSNGLSGKVLSAVHDDYEHFPERLGAIMRSDIYTYRRVKPDG